MAVDTLGRPGSIGPISLRVSVTDRCQYRCLYCTPVEGVRRFPHEDILRHEEIVGFVGLVRRRLGLSKVHVTGGEPLVRRGIVELVRMLADEGAEDLAMTTNGLRLTEMAGALKQAGLRRVNVSLDSLDAATFGRLTRGGDPAAALAGIQAAVDAGLTPVKLNAALLRGVNDGEAAALADFAIRHDMPLRFIELMPFGEAAKRFDAWFVGSQEVLDRLARRFTVTPLARGNGGSTRWYQLTDSQGRTGTVGMISGTTEPFCRDCNRLRLTATGELIGCLARDRAESIRALLRAEGKLDEDAILAKIHAVMRHKRTCGGFSSRRDMTQVGG